MKLIDLIHQKGSEVISVTSSDSVSQAAKTLCDHRVGSALVYGDEENVVGIVSERDLVQGIRQYGEELARVTVADLMSSNVLRVAPDESVTGAMAIMTNERIRHLPVFDGDRLMGIISIGDLVKNRIEEIEAEASYLREYIAM